MTISRGNSTSTPLGAGEVFTGEASVLRGYSVVFISVHTDVASAIDGLGLQQSIDGENWDHVDNYSIAAGASKNYSVNPHSLWFRVVYTNGGIAQSEFRLQVIFKVGNAKASSHRIKNDISGDDDAELVKAAITGENGDGNWRNVKVDSDGNLSIHDRSSGLSIAQGAITGASFIHKFGAAPDFDIGDGFITVWDGADDGAAWENMVYDYSSTTDIDSISSSSSANIGLDIEVQGLDANYDLITQTISLDGADSQDRVALTTNLIRVFRLKNVSATDITGVVTVYPNTALTTGVPTDKSKIRAVLIGDNNQTEMAVFTIPNGKTGYLRSMYATTASSQRASSHVVKLLARPFGQVFQLKHKSAIVEAGASHMSHNYVEPEVFSAKTDIEVRVNTDVNGAAIAAGFDIVLIDE